MTGYNCKTVFHMSSDRLHILVHHFPDLKIHRQTDTPVTGECYAKKFGKPTYWYRLDESETWLPMAQFAPVFLQARFPEKWEELQKARSRRLKAANFVRAVI